MDIDRNKQDVKLTQFHTQCHMTQKLYIINISYMKQLSLSLSMRGHILYKE